MKKIISILSVVFMLSACASTIENAGIPFVSNHYANKREALEKEEKIAQEQKIRDAAKESMEKYRENTCNTLLTQIETIKPHTDGYYYLSEYKDFLTTVNDCYMTGSPQAKYCDVNMSENTCVVSLESKVDELEVSNNKLKAKNPAPPDEVIKYCGSYLYGALFSYWKIEQDCFYPVKDAAYSYKAFSRGQSGVLFTVTSYDGSMAGPFFVYTKKQYSSRQDIGGYLKYKGEYSYTGVDGFTKKVMAFDRYNQTCEIKKQQGEIKQVCSKMQKE